jgi:hypothetical protein
MFDITAIRKFEKFETRKNGLVRELHFGTAFDERHKDPKKNYGWHGMDMVFVIKKGKTKCVTFRIFTNWHWDEKFYEGMSKPSGASIDLHTTNPQFKGQKKYGQCDFLGKECYCDGSCLAADNAFKILTKDGLEALFDYMETWLK